MDTGLADDGGRVRTALVTGASVGLGRSIALALADDGYRLALADMAGSDLAAVLEACNARTPGAKSFVLDLRKAESIAGCCAAARAHFGALDLLVNNAGVALHRPVVDLAWEEWDTVLDVNLKGTFFMCQAFGSALIAQGRAGAIVNIASTHGIVGLADRAAYGISKAGVIHMTKMLAVEWAAHGIRVNAVAPGTVMTPSRDALLRDPAARQRMLDRIPLGRFPTAEEVAAAVRYLGGRDAGSMTGHTLVLDGGTTVW